MMASGAGQGGMGERWEGEEEERERGSREQESALPTAEVSKDKHRKRGTWL